MPANSLNSVTIPLAASNRIGRLSEPMRTRVQFYLEQCARKKKQGELLVEREFNECVGRAYLDGQDDREVSFPSDSVSHAVEAIKDPARLVDLEELIGDAC